jgi:mediator of RNA polymerase II transcription subunit 17
MGQLDTDTLYSHHLDEGACTEKCDLIYSSLHALLLRRHWHMKLRRLGNTGIIRPPVLAETTHAPPILRPIIDLLQYQVFCERIKSEIDKMVEALSAVGIPATLRFDPVGETGQQLIRLFDDNVSNIVGGEAVLRIDNRYVFSTFIMRRFLHQKITATQYG